MRPRLLHRTLAVALSLASASVVLAADRADAERRAEVARRGAEGMPFDLSKTRHVFTKTRHGGVQRVVAKDAADSTQVRLVRQHLRAIEAQFRAGEFAAPAHIHGETMPGLAELQAAPKGAVAIGYADVKGGAELTFTSRDDRFVDALHRWFDAQLSDHGSDAVAGQAQHQHGDSPKH